MHVLRILLPLSRLLPSRSLLALMTLAMAVVPATSWSKTKRVALLVANHDGGDGLPKLRYAERDAKRMQEVLQDMGGFDDADIVRVVDEESTDFMQALAELEQKSRRYQAQGFDTVLVVYYSGHAENGVLRMGQSKMPMSLLRTQLDNSQADVRLALVDSCGAGAITRDKGGKKAPPFLIHVDDNLGAKGQVIIASSSADEVSQESDDIQGSFFTHYMVSGLRGDADDNQDGNVTLDEAYTYAYGRTVAATSGSRSGAQHPTYDYRIQGAGDVVLTRSSRAEVNLTFAAHMQGSYLVVDLDRQLFVAEVKKTPGQASSLSLPKGNYAVKKRLDTHLLLQRVSAREKGSYRVDENQMQEVSFDDDYAKGTPILIETHDSLDTVFSMSFGLGVQGVLFEPEADKLGSLFPAIGFAHLELRLSNFVADHVTLATDVGFGTREHAVQIDPDGAYGGPFTFNGQYSQLQIGAGLYYDVRFFDFSLTAGPRLAFLLVHMAYTDGPLAHQSYPAFTPGLSVSVGYHPFTWLHIEGTARTSYLLYTADNFQHLAVTEALLSLWIDL